ncbi:hypothetical protein K435DRAFT_974418 [Dendrothele bispora CBS 962.96]|uniref:Uncharacterized protein n=1 Tax=Dendrothele bispora (strain CBS 962.96) TaxID=1314807 RepID=A0A4S8KLJ7_DENBC|nr:hypothetical protein K435DRAFT_974418 [Dendrothele bispora CBS 962.96]
MLPRTERPTKTILAVPANGTKLKECTPYLMPFHIEYTGTAPVSTYLAVEEAKKNVGAPDERKSEDKPEAEKEPDGERKDVVLDGNHETAEELVVASSTSVEITVSNSKSGGDVDTEMLDAQNETQPVADDSIEPNNASSTSALAPAPTLVSTVSLSTVASSSTTMLSVSSSSNTIVPSSTSSSSLNTGDSSSYSSLKPRFKSTFRGRIIQGLAVDVPPGYTGVILHSTDNDDDTPVAKAKRQAAIATARMSEKVKAKKKAAALKGKTRKVEVREDEVEEVIEESQSGTEKRTTRRSTRSTTRSGVIDVDVIDDDDDEQGHGYGDDDSESWGAGNNDTFTGSRENETTKTLEPTSTFSSFVLWHPDIPVDEGSDEYYGALNEWVAIAQALHRVPED